MALKKYTKTVAVTLLDGSSLTFSGEDGFAATAALEKYDQIHAKASDSKTYVIPYHAVLKAEITNGSADATAVEDAACAAIEG